MQAKSIRVLAMVCPGPYQDYLVDQLDQHVELACVVVQSDKNSQAAHSTLKRFSRYLNPFASRKYLLARLRLPAYESRAAANLAKNVPDFYRSSGW